jgi:hypothetical protein
MGDVQFRRLCLCKLNVYRRQRLKPTTRRANQAAATTQLPRGPLPEQPASSKLELLNKTKYQHKHQQTQEWLAMTTQLDGTGGHEPLSKMA